MSLPYALPTALDRPGSYASAVPAPTWSAVATVHVLAALFLQLRVLHCVTLDKALKGNMAFKI